MKSFSETASHLYEQYETFYDNNKPRAITLAALATAVTVISAALAPAFTIAALLTVSTGCFFGDMFDMFSHHESPQTPPNTPASGQSDDSTVNNDSSKKVITALGGILRSVPSTDAVAKARDESQSSLYDGSLRSYTPTSSNSGEAAIHPSTGSTNSMSPL